MRIPVLLSIRGCQNYIDQEPDVIELVTEGTLEQTASGWDITYAETALTAMEGVFTTFQVAKDQIVLTRTGKLQSQMVFQEGKHHESLYRMEFGALMISVCATKILWDVSDAGGTVDLSYNISIEHTAAGTIDYHLDIRTIG